MNLFGSKDYGEHWEYEPCLVKQLSTENEDKEAEVFEEEQRLEKKMKLPLILRLIKIIAYMGMLTLTVAVLEVGIRGSFSQGFSNAPWVFYGCAFSWLIYITLRLLQKEKRRKIMSSEEYIAWKRKSEETKKQVNQDMGIPDDACKIDVLAEEYHEKKGALESSSVQTNFACEMFLESGFLYIYHALLGSLIRVPCQSLGNAERARETCFLEWNKEQAYNSSTYKPYKIRKNRRNNMMYYSQCYNIPVNDVWGDYYLQIPNYDMEAFAQLTGVQFEDLS